MKKLYLLRHAQPEINTRINDKERSLTQTGIEQSIKVGEFLKSYKILPELFLCSNAIRTKETLEHVVNRLEIAPNIKYMENLYYASANDMQKIVSGIDNKFNYVMIISHNPTISVYANLLVHTGMKEDLKQLGLGFNPATLVIINIDCNNWQQSDNAKGELECLVRI